MTAVSEGRRWVTEQRCAHRQITAKQALGNGIFFLRDTPEALINRGFRASHDLKTYGSTRDFWLVPRRFCR